MYIMMDIPRQSQKGRRIAIRIAILLLVLIVIPLTTLGLSRLGPAVPSAERQTLLFDKVNKGDMVLEVRGMGTLVSEDMLVVPATMSGRITKILVEAGTVVEPNTVILELSNPELQLQLLDAQSALNTAKARLNAEKANLQDRLLGMEANLAQSQADYEKAKLTNKVEKKQFEDGLISELQSTLSQNSVENQSKLLEIHKQRYDVFCKQTMPALFAELEAAVRQAESLYALRKSQVDSLQVRAGVSGVLSPIQDKVELGQQVSAGQVLARVTNPQQLKARLQIPQGQVRDVQIGLLVEIDTYNGTVSGRVSRIDPTVVEGNVTVDVHLDGTLPKGARPDLSVVGTIQIDKLVGISYVGRPVMANTNSKCSLFKVVDNGKFGQRVAVQFGRASVSMIEVMEGLVPGDEIILSDISQFDKVDRIRIK
jgi:HlyD family secretion protein